MSEISVQNLAKSWGDSHAVRDVSFTVPEGSLTVLLGPSGCGKSTTLRLIAGLDEVSRGTVLIAGKDVTGSPASKRNISMVFQSYALFPHLSVAENILFGLKVRRTPKPERDEKLKQTAELLGLSALLERKPAQLSGGQQQRVALGRAVISGRPVCLMDEPLSNLDAKLRHEMRIELRALQQKLGLTMVYVTHDQAEAISMADQIVLLNNGLIEQAATPVTIYREPATMFTAQFIGTPPMNILSLEVKADSQCLAGTNQVVLPGGAGAQATLGLRPEDIAVADTGLPAEVRSVEFLGADALVDCMLGDNVMTVRLAGARTPEVGETLPLSWPAEAQHFFHKDTGLRRTELGEGAAEASPHSREGQGGVGASDNSTPSVKREDAK
ncbi:MAG: ABC transporter ATP-binding protein [Pseudomonadota bacterium]